MSTAPRRDLLSVGDYLEGEQNAQQKHEYVHGVIYAQAGATNVHNQIATNAMIALGSQLRGHSCRVLNSDTKIRIRQAKGHQFYYPDLSVVCRPNPSEDHFQDAPAVIVEVLSNRTRRTDEGEKRDAYLSIESLFTYILLEQSSASAYIYQRGPNHFEQLTYFGLHASIPLPQINAELKLADAYDGVALVEEPPDGD